jgi:hypothetical protein
MTLMCEREPEWKRERVESLQGSITFFSNREKLTREKFVVARLLRSLGFTFEEHEMIKGDEPGDVAFREALFQVKELLEPGRRRTAEYRDALKQAMAAEEFGELTETYTPINVSFTEIAARCQERAEFLVQTSKYGNLERMQLDLVIYVNLTDHHEVPPDIFERKEVGFRSLSVVGNRYCSVLFAQPGAPEFIAENLGRVIDFIEA